MEDNINSFVPDFHEMEEDYSFPTSSGFSRLKKPATDEEEIMELLWQNGQVLVQQIHTPFADGGGGGAVFPAEQAVVKEIRAGGAEGEEEDHLFMEEDAMASWLQYPIDDSSSLDHDFYEDLFDSAPPATTTVAPPRAAAAEVRSPPARKPGISPRLQKSVHFSRLSSRPRMEPVSVPPVTTAVESTVVESNVTPASPPLCSLYHTVDDTERGTAAAERRNSEADRGELGAVRCELTVTSSPGGSASSFSASAEQQRPPDHKPETSAAEDRKRKAREADDNGCQSEGNQFEAAEAKKQACGSASSKRARATQVHNLSERRRRDRINEKMRILQELIPRYNKSDKASMLDEAIEYVKSLQLQIQMMSMGYGMMVPMVHHGMLQYMPGTGMGMSMDMGMNRPLMPPYPFMLPGSAMPNPVTAAHMSPRFPMPALHPPQVPLPDPSMARASNQNEPMLNSLVTHDPNQPQVQSCIDPYQQFLGLHQAQLPLPQNQAAGQLSKNSNGKEFGNPENKQSGRK